MCQAAALPPCRRTEGSLAAAGHWSVTTVRCKGVVAPPFCRQHPPKKVRKGMRAQAQGDVGVTELGMTSVHQRQVNPTTVSTSGTMMGSSSIHTPAVAVLHTHTDPSHDEQRGPTTTCSGSGLL